MIGRIAVALAIVAVVAVDFVLWLNAIRHPGERAADTVLLLTALVSFLASSVLFAEVFRRRGQRTLAVMFALNVVLFLAMEAMFQLHAIRVRWGLAVSAGLFMYWLNQYLVVLASQWAHLWESDATHIGATIV